MVEKIYDLTISCPDEEMMATATRECLSQIFVPHSRAYEDDLREEKQRRQPEFQERVRKIRKSQAEYGALFSQLSAMIGQLRNKYAMINVDEVHQIEHQQHQPDDDTASNSSTNERSSGVSTSSDMHVSHASSCGSMYADSTTRKARKRSCKAAGVGDDGAEEDCDDDDLFELDMKADEDEEEMFPQLLDGGESPLVQIGPNGTTLCARAYGEIIWSGVPAASTRSLLSVIFSSDTLATHTLTGKPSPAFYGRERPSKMQLDPDKVKDIIHCVRAKCGGSEREIRSAITTKCADTAKKYKRRLQRKSKGNFEKEI